MKVALDSDAAVEGGVPPRHMASLYSTVVRARLLKTHHDVLVARHGTWIREAVERDDVGSFEQGAEMDLYLSLWHALLYALIETWGSLRISSPEIDQLLADGRIRLLRDFRNAILHPRDFMDARINALTKRGSEGYEFYVQVLEAFERFVAPIAEKDRARRRHYPDAP